MSEGGLCSYVGSSVWPGIPRLVVNYKYSILHDVTALDKKCITLINMKVFSLYMSHLISLAIM